MGDRVSVNLKELKNLTEEFIRSRVAGNGLDQRTEKAYRMDLGLFCAWVEQVENGSLEKTFGQGVLEDWMDKYLDYLKREKELSFSTLYRKNRVLSYFLSYLTEKKILAGCRKLKSVGKADKMGEKAASLQMLLSKKDADAFFAAMNREYEQLSSEFRRRICLRDMVMMELLFYHKIEISELLQIEIMDYCGENGELIIRRKKGEEIHIRLYSQELMKKIGLWLDERKAFPVNQEYAYRMFISKLGKPLSMEMLIQIFDKYRKLAGIEKKFTPKDLKESSMKQYAKELMMEQCSRVG